MEQKLKILDNSNTPEKVNPKWIAFAKEYCTNGYNASEAYKVAYNSKKGARVGGNASNLLKKPEVQAIIDREMAAIISIHNISADAVASEILKILDICKADGDRHNALKALDMLNKMSGFYNHKTEMDVRAQGIIFNFIEPIEKNSK